MIVVSEYSPLLEYSPSTRDLEIIANAAKLSCEKVHFLPLDIKRFGNIKKALHHIPEASQMQCAIWIGYIPSNERYEQVYNELLAKKLQLLNTPEQHQRAKLFHLAYPFIADVTPKSCVIKDVEECESALEKLSFPLFVKGSVLSQKAKGLNACVAHNLEQLVDIVAKILKYTWKTSGYVIIREYVELKYVRTFSDFPFGREFRLFLYQNKVLECGYYWEGEDELSVLSNEEEKEVLDLAVKTAQKVETPYIAIDIGQKKTGEWIVIETGDAQFAGVSQIEPLKLWSKIGQLA